MATESLYHQFLGLDPNVEKPSYYQLLAIAETERTEEVIEQSFKSQMMKLQQIKSTKHKGFLEYLKDELRKARRILSNDGKRAEYTQELKARAVEDFKKDIESFIQISPLPRSIYEVLIARAPSHNLTEEEAAAAISGLGVIVADADSSDQLDAVPDPEPPRRPNSSRRSTTSTSGRRPAPQPRDSNSGRRPKDSGRRRPTDAPSRRSPSGRLSPPTPERRGSERFELLPPPANVAPSHRPIAPPLMPPRGGYSSGREMLRPPDNPSIPKSGRGNRRYNDYFMAPEKAASEKLPPPKGRRPQKTSLSRRRDSEYRNKVKRVVLDYNRGIKSAKLALRAHHSLQDYFPPHNKKREITLSINGVSYEQVFDAEMKQFREANKYFTAVLERVLKESLDDGLPENFTRTINRNLDSIKNYMNDGKQLKLKLIGGVQKQEELRIWGEFMRERPRNELLAQMIDFAD